MTSPFDTIREALNESDELLAHATMALIELATGPAYTQLAARCNDRQQRMPQAKAALAALRDDPNRVPAWISVKDQMPPAHQNVWCYNRDGRQFEGRICYGMHKPFFTYPYGDGNASNTAPDWINVSHWRPLSPGPKP